MAEDSQHSAYAEGMVIEIRPCSIATRTAQSGHEQVRCKINRQVAGKRQLRTLAEGTGRGAVLHESAQEGMWRRGLAFD